MAQTTKADGGLTPTVPLWGVWDTWGEGEAG